MVTYIRSDLDFILAQIKIAEDHALNVTSGGVDGKPLVRAGRLDPDLQPVLGAAHRRRHLQQPAARPDEWGAADNDSPSGSAPTSGPSWCPAGPGGALVPVTYTPGVDNDGPGTSAGPGDVFDPYVRTISNLIVDQTLGNPSAILTALQRAGIVAAGRPDGGHGADLRAYEPLMPLFNAVWRRPSARTAEASGGGLCQPRQSRRCRPRPPRRLADAGRRAQRRSTPRTTP